MLNNQIPTIAAALGCASALLCQETQAITPEQILAMEAKSPLPGAITLNAMAAVGNTVVAIGLDGAAVKSANGGLTWSRIQPFVLNNRFEEMYGCATDGTRVVATGRLPAVTTDFETWEWGAWNPGFRFDVAYGAGKFVATGRVSNVAVSTDGLSWSDVELPAGTINLEVIEFGNGVFAAAGAGGRILRSTDGMTWEIARAGSADDGWFRHMAFANGRFIANGDNDMFFSSTDGLNWTSHTAERIRNVGTHFNGRYVSLDLKHGTDFTNFDGDPINSAGSANDMRILGGRIVAVGRHGSLSTSEDGITWVDRRETLGETFWSVAFGSGHFVIQDRSTNRLFTSTNGKFWTLRFQGDNSFRTNVAFGGGIFCALTRERTCVRSTDGITWEETGEVMPFISDTRGLHYLNGRFVTVGNGGGVASSTNGGVTWTTHDSGTDTRLTDIAFANGRYVAVGFSTDTYTSTNLSSWTTVESGFGSNYIVAEKGKFVVLNPGGTSTDGITWTPFTPHNSVRFGAIDTDPELGIYSLLDSRMFVKAPSSELTDWDGLFFQSTDYLHAIAGGNGIAVGVGSGGLVMATPIEAGGYDAWVTVRLAGQPVAQKSPAADPDADGVSNIEEYARGTSPTQPTEQLKIEIARSQLGVTASWNQGEAEDIDDVTTGLEYSTDLRSWTSAGVLVNISGDDYSARVTGQAGVSEELYLRVVWGLK